MQCPCRWQSVLYMELLLLNGGQLAAFKAKYAKQWLR